MMKTRIMYVELKAKAAPREGESFTRTSGFDDRGDAWITRVRFSKTGRSIYFRDKLLQKAKGLSFANAFDAETGDEYWISGPKKEGGDRHWAGGGPIRIDEEVREEYWTEIRRAPERKHETFA